MDLKMTFNDLSKEILIYILKLLPREKAYKFFLINSECYNIYPKFHNKALYWGTRSKFYNLVKITCNWNNSNYDLDKINEHYGYLEDCYINKSFGKKLLKRTNWSQYFIDYLDLYEKKSVKLLLNMNKYNVF